MYIWYNIYNTYRTQYDREIYYVRDIYKNMLV